jgi:hypothetical protein
VTRDDLIKILGEWVRVTNPHAPVTWTGQLVGLADDPSLLLRIGPGQQATLPQRFDVEHLELDPANEADDEHGKPLHCRDCAQAWLDGKPTPPQDGPHAPQDGPEAPDADAETPDGAGGRQAATEPLARLRRLRGQLAAEHAKAVRADQQPRPDLDHLRVSAHNGIAAGLEIAIFFADHHLREAGEESEE